MRKVVFAFVICLSVVLGACKHTVVTEYTIGCLSTQMGSIEGSNWDGITNYFNENVEYNKIVSFEGNSVSENDTQAKQFFEKQMEKVDQEYVCSMLNEPDYIIYGIKTINADGTYRTIAATKFTASGAEPVQ